MPRLVLFQLPNGSGITRAFRAEPASLSLPLAGDHLYQVKRLRRLWLLCAITCLVAGCEKERASGTVVGPIAGPRVAESVLALGVVDGVPVGITDIFARGETVHLWVHWEALRPPHEAEAVWIDPLGNEVDATVLAIGGRAAEQVTVFSLRTTALSETGRWDVDLYLDSELQRGHSFLVVDVLPAQAPDLP